MTNVRLVTRPQIAHVTVSMVTGVASALVIAGLVQNTRGIDVTIIRHVTRVSRRDFITHESVSFVTIVALTPEFRANGIV